MQRTTLELVSYSIGYYPIMLVVATMMGHFQYVFADVLKFPPKELGVLWTVYSLVSALTQPIAGRLSNQLGERNLFMFSIVPTLCGYYYTWNSLDYNYVLVSLIIFGVSESLLQVSYFSMFATFVEDEEQRITTATYKQMCSILGLLSGMALPPIIGWANLQSIIHFVLIMCVVCYIIALYGTRRSISKQPTTPTTKQSYDVCDDWGCRSQPFRWLLCAQFLIQLGNALLGSSFPLHQKYVMNINHDVRVFDRTIPVGVQMSMILTSFYVVGLASTPIWAKITTLKGPLITFRLNCILYAFLLSYYLLPFVHEFHMCIIGSSTLGIALSGFLSLPDMLLSKIVDIDGKKRPGTFFGVRGVVLKMASALQGLIVGHVLMLFEYNPDIEVQNPNTTFGITLITILFPMILFTCGGVLLGRVNIVSNSSKKES